MTRPARTAPPAAPAAFPTPEGLKPMTLYQITVHHNNDSRFMAYEDGHRLTATVSHWCERPDAAPLMLANWAWHVFNADLDMLENNRTTRDGEADFLLACVYRLLQLRSLSVGDVIEISTDHHWWLACDPIGWRHISPPTNLHGQPLTAEKVYRHLHEQRQSQ